MIPSIAELQCSMEEEFSLMQGQRNTVDPFPGMEQGSVSNDSGTSQQQIPWNNMLNPVETHPPNYVGANLMCGNSMDCDVPGFSGWSLGESSSSLSERHQFIDDGAKMESTWSASSGVNAGTGLRLDERRFGTSDIHPHENINVGPHGSLVTNGSLFYSTPSPSRTPHNIDLNVRFSVNAANCDGGSVLYKSGGSETEHVASSNCNVGTSRGFFLEERDDGSSSSSSANWGLSCKRKALDGTSRQFYSGGSSNCFPQADDTAQHAFPALLNTSGSLNITTTPTNTPIGSPPVYMNRGSDAFPSSHATCNAETSLANLNRRAAGLRRETALFNLQSAGSSRGSNGLSSHQSPRPLPVSDRFDLRSAANTAATPSQLRAPRMSRNVLPFQWNDGSSGSIPGSSSNSVNPHGERSAFLREVANRRNVLRSNTEHPVFLPTPDHVNMSQDMTGWSFGTGNVGNHGGVPSHIGSGSGWMPNQNSPVQTQQRLSEFPPWPLFTPSVDAEPHGRSGHFPSFSSGLSASPQEMITSSDSNNQGHHQFFPRSMFLLERQGDDVLGSSQSFQSLAADIEGRHRLISEIRQVLSAMRRGEQLRAEDYMVFDPLVYYGMTEMHDRHRDMRLDVDNMTYEELLALGERIGDVKTGLSEESIMKHMVQRKLVSVVSGDMEPCCICQEEYGGGDDVGRLACGHDFHRDCVKQWLMRKNLCPICKTMALVTMS